MNVALRLQSTEPTQAADFLCVGDTVFFPPFYGIFSTPQSINTLPIRIMDDLTLISVGSSSSTTTILDTNYREVRVCLSYVFPWEVLTQLKKKEVPLIWSQLTWYSAPQQRLWTSSKDREQTSAQKQHASGGCTIFSASPGWLKAQDKAKMEWTALIKLCIHTSQTESARNGPATISRVSQQFSTNKMKHELPTNPPFPSLTPTS